MFNKIMFIRYHRQGFPNSVKGKGVFRPVREREILLGEYVFSMMTNSSLKTKNEYLYTGIINTVFQRCAISILHISNRILIF